MEIIPVKLLIVFGLLGAAFLVNSPNPLVAALLGIIASIVFLWLIVGGGK